MPGLLGGCHRQTGPNVSRSVAVPTAQSVPTRMAPPGDVVAVGAALAVAANGPHIVMPTASGSNITPSTAYPHAFVRAPAVPTVECRLRPGGEANAFVPGPSLRTGRGWHTWDGQGGICLAQFGDERVAILEQYPRSAMEVGYLCPVATLTLEHGRARATSSNFGIPCGVGDGAFGAYVPSVDITDPSAAVVGDRLWVVTCDRSSHPFVSSARWGRFGGDGWELGHELGDGYCPRVAGTPAAGVFVAYIRAKRDQRQGYRSTGRVALQRLADGREWEELPDVPGAHGVGELALAVDPAAGLCIIYTAWGEAGPPLMAIRSADFGRTWGEPRRLTGPETSASSPQVVSHGGRLYVAYVATPRAPGAPPGGVYTFVLDPLQLPGGAGGMDMPFPGRLAGPELFAAASGTAAEASAASPTAPSVQQHR